MDCSSLAHCPCTVAGHTAQHSEHIRLAFETPGFPEQSSHLEKHSSEDTYILDATALRTTMLLWLPNAVQCRLKNVEN